MNAPKPPLVVIAGPTASGKSALALRIAEEARGTVINADASQVYADLRILTARPSVAEEARAPHRLYGVIDGDVSCSAAIWADMAREAIEAVVQEGRIPILVGGSGLYIRTLLEGIAPVPPVPDAVREAVRALPVAEAWEALRREDRGAAARLNAADRQRVARALEVVLSTGRTLADWQAEAPVGGLEADLHACVVEVERDALYRRCDARFGAMLEEGALDEVRALLARNLPDDRPVMKALGVPPLARHLAGELTLDEAAEIARRDTRHYAKRQSTWFRNQNPLWNRIRSTNDAEKMVSKVIKLLN